MADDEAVIATVVADGGAAAEKRVWEDEERFSPGVVRRVKRARTGLTATTQALECPITQAGPMWRPVMGADGHSYEEGAWQKWIAECRKNRTPVRSPLTNKPCRPWFTPNTALRKVIEGLVAGGLIPKGELAGYNLRAEEAAEYEELMAKVRKPDGDHAGACRDLMRLYEKGNAVIVASEEIAAVWARRGALLGVPACRERHARGLLESEVDENRARGIHFLTLAAQEGVDAAMYGMAMLLMGNEDFDGYGGEATRAALGRDLWHAKHLLERVMQLENCEEYETSEKNVLRHASPADKAEFFERAKKALDALRPQLEGKGCEQL